MSFVQAAPMEPAPAEMPRQAVTQEEAQAIADHFNLDDVDSIHVSWVDGYKGRQALLWPIKAKWLGYMMVVTILLTARVSKPVMDPNTTGISRRSQHAALVAAAR